MTITLCGGGNLGHVLAGYLSSQPGTTVSLLTSRPSAWSSSLEVSDSQGRIYRGSLQQISANPADVIPTAQIVLLCLPGYAFQSVMEAIAPYLSPSTWVGSVVSSTGFFFQAGRHLPSGQPLFGFQRVPFISRIAEYGHRAELKGYKDSLSVAVLPPTSESSESGAAMLSHFLSLFHVPVRRLDSIYQASLSNSNPLLHTSRLYTLWHNWQPGITYPDCPMFYSDWTLEASHLYLAMDDELQHLARILGLPPGSIPTVLDYYESTDAESLTAKLRSIQGFRGIPSPMRQTDAGWQPDLQSRYFHEDFPCGLRYPWQLARQHSLATPNIDKVYHWGMKMINSAQ